MASANLFISALELIESPIRRIFGMVFSFLGVGTLGAGFGGEGTESVLEDILDGVEELDGFIGGSGDASSFGEEESLVLVCEALISCSN